MSLVGFPRDRPCGQDSGGKYVSGSGPRRNPQGSETVRWGREEGQAKAQSPAESPGSSGSDRGKDSWGRRAVSLQAFATRLPAA